MSTTRRGKVGPAGEVARPRCAILARVSTEEQHLDAQTGLLKAEAARRGFDLVAVVEDVGSGRAMEEREGLRQVLDLADARAIDVLLVAELSRVGRSLCGLARVLDRLAARDVMLVSLRENFDLASSMGRAMAGMLAVFAQFEADVLSERTSAGMGAAAARGRAVGQAPFGTRWRLSSDEDAPADLVPVASELATLRRAVQLHAELGTWKDAAAALTAEGRLPRAGRRWFPNMLSLAVRNPRARRFLDASSSPVAMSAAV